MNANRTSKMLQEASFGPSATDRFDFTLGFENIILSILPSALFLILAPQRLFLLKKQSRKVAKSSRSVLKFVLISVYTFLQLAVLLYWTLGPVYTLKVQTAAAVLVFVAGLLLIFVSHAEHIRSVRPSSLISAYLFFTLLFDCVVSRTLWLLDGTGVRARLFTSTVAIKVLVLGIEAWEKRSILLAQYRDLSPEVTSGILSRSVFIWLNSLMKLGYPVHDSMVSRKLLPRLQATWNNANQHHKNSLAFSTLSANKYVFLSGVLPRLFLAASKYTLPFLISTTTSFAEDPSQPDSTGWGLTGAWLLVFLAQAVSNGFYYQMTNRFVASVRGSLCSLIYVKTLDTSVSAHDESVAVTLMSTDTENICQSAATLHEIWASPIECGVAIYLLCRQLGFAALAPVVVALVATTAIMQLSKYIGNAQKVWMSGIQTRVDVTASVLGSMKEVKMLGLSDTVTQMVHNLRLKELKLSKRYRRLLCLQTFIGMNTRTIAPLATFAIFVIIAQRTGQPLDTASAYSSLPLIYLLSNPLVVVIRAIPFLSSALACFGRIQDFLRSDTRKDHRQRLVTSNPRDEPPLGNSSPRLSTESASVALHDLDREASLPCGAPVMVISDASYGWNRQDPPVLSNISTAILKSSFTFIVGNVGSGKSTLMKAMLGEIQPLKGSIYTAIRKTAVVGQEPWIQNLTIRQNILGFSTFDRDWYSRVIYACGLEKDLAEVLDGDATKAGSAGVSLSGGQKQRLALARAVYSREQVVFLDDVFAGQDAATEDHIFRNLFARKGLFREMGTTVVCITNAIYRLMHADTVIVLGENGHILHQGSFNKLQTDTDYLSGIKVQQKRPANAQNETEPSTYNHTLSTRSRAPDIEVEPTERGSGELSTYGYYFGSVPIWHTLLFAAFVLFYAGGYKMTELLLSFWTANASAGKETTKFYLGIYGMLSGLAVIGISGAAYFFLITMVPLSSEVLHTRLLRSVLDAPLAFFTRTDVGVTTNRFSQDMSVIDTELPFALVDFSVNFAVLLMGTILMCVFSGYFAATVPPVVLFCWLLQKFYLKTSRQIRILDLEAKSPLFTQFLDLVRGLSSVRAFVWETSFLEQYLDLLDASQRPYYLLFCIQRWLGVVLDLMVAVLVAIIMILVVKLRSQLSPQFVALALLNIMSFSQSLAHVIQDWTQLEMSFGAVARIKTFCSETETEKLPSSELSPVPENWPSRGHVSIENLVASYTPGGEPVLRGVSIDIPAGFKVGICGRSGSGKSSLVGALLRLLETSPSDHSRITFDGLDINAFSRQAIRAAVAVVPQHPFFLKNTSVRGNLSTIVPPHLQNQERCSNDDEILAVLRRLNMTDTVERMGGLGGALDADRLSQGQRQLLCLARAMLAGKKIILLDEASSNVDERSERLIRQVIREHFADCTVIAVVHRLGAVADFDRVAVMGGGRLLEWDSPQALLARDSEFKRLWNLGSGV